MLETGIGNIEKERLIVEQISRIVGVISRDQGWTRLKCARTIWATSKLYHDDADGPTSQQHICTFYNSVREFCNVIRELMLLSKLQTCLEVAT